MFHGISLYVMYDHYITYDYAQEHIASYSFLSHNIIWNSMSNILYFSIVRYMFIADQYVFVFIYSWTTIWSWYIDHYMIITKHQPKKPPIPNFSGFHHGFIMVFLWFSHGFPMKNAGPEGSGGGGHWCLRPSGEDIRRRWDGALMDDV